MTARDDYPSLAAGRIDHDEVERALAEIEKLRDEVECVEGELNFALGRAEEATRMADRLTAERVGLRRALLRAKLDGKSLRAKLDGKSAALQALALDRRSCTPAERALIYAAVAWRRAMRDCRDLPPTARFTTWAEVNDAMCAAVDAVLAERGEA